jgi:propionate CoA-transferase
MPNHPAAAALRASDTGKIVSAREAVALIRDGDTVAATGFVGIGFAENLADALERHDSAVRIFDTGEAARTSLC